jgi:hypothetical protein
MTLLGPSLHACSIRSDNDKKRNRAVAWSKQLQERLSRYSPMIMGTTFADILAFRFMRSISA